MRQDVIEAGEVAPGVRIAMFPAVDHRDAGMTDEAADDQGKPGKRESAMVVGDLARTGDPRRLARSWIKKCKTISVRHLSLHPQLRMGRSRRLRRQMHPQPRTSMRIST